MIGCRLPSMLLIAAVLSAPLLAPLNLFRGNPGWPLNTADLAALTGATKHAACQVERYESTAPGLSAERSTTPSRCKTSNG